ncbi:hypothetical protein [Amycolatopsis alba]|uniref:hypothetical protein n=1 Tax=Amycolatopsis alba TaxID=76020 RepID=UPI0012F808C0|nr:hypothetical protein [Amycolatopsis alba]
MGVICSPSSLVEKRIGQGKIEVPGVLVASVDEGFDGSPPRHDGLGEQARDRRGAQGEAPQNRVRAELFIPR